METVFFNQAGICTHWQAPIRTDYWCPTWRDLTATSPLPASPSCITGVTIPILLTQDFNDIGVYTPWDGLAYQRETLNNFVYTGNGNSITIFNTSNLEFKKFLRVAPYTIDWGDGATGTLTSPSQTVATHTYTTPSTAYTITLKQVNPWGTTYVSKSLPIPYLHTPPILNPFGTFAIQPPNIGDPIGCDYITQDYIFSGDSNPDVWDFYSMHYKDVPFQVTGYSYTSQLNMLAQYGNAPYPMVGQIVSVGLSGHGVINIIEPSYTAYTINHIDYTDYSAGTTSYSATSRGLWWGNLDYKCCTDEQLDGCDCTNEVEIYSHGHTTIIDLGNLIMLGNGNLGPWTTGYPYIEGDIVTYLGMGMKEPCCFVCISHGLCSDKDPRVTAAWAACNDCKEQDNATGNYRGNPGDPPPSIDPDELYRCEDSSCSQIPKHEITMSGNTYSSLLSLPTVYQTLPGCQAGCGCTGLQQLPLTITNPSVCTAFVDTGGHWNLNCDGVVQITGFDIAQSSQYTITNNNTGEIKTIVPISGYYYGVDFDNLCPSSYSNVNGNAAGLYNFTIEDIVGCTTYKTILVEPDPIYFTVLPPNTDD